MPPPVRYDEHGRPVQERRTPRYDENGNVVSQAQKRVSPLEDVARSFGTGIERGVAFTAGMPRDLTDLGDAAARWAAQQGANLAPRSTNDLIDPGRRERVANRVSDEIIGTRRRVAAALLPFAPAFGPVAPAIFGGFLPSGEQLNQSLNNLTPGEQHEPQTTAGEFARTVGEFVPGAVLPAGRAGSVAGSIARRLGVNVAAPALASEAAGQVSEGSAIEPVARLGGAIAGGVLAHNAGNIASRFNMTPDQRAVRMIDRGLRDAGTNIDTVSRQAGTLRRQGGRTVETVAEVSARQGARNQPLQRMARAVANVRGPGQQIAEDTLSARTDGVTQRVLNDATRVTAPQQTRAPRNYYDAREQLRVARAGQARGNYRAAYEQPVDQRIYDAEIAPLMVGGPVQEGAARRALEIARAEVLRTQAQISLARQLAPEVQTLQSTVASLEAKLQTAARGSRAAIERQLAVAQDELSRARELVDDAQGMAQDLAGTQAAVNDLTALAAGKAPAAANARVIDYFQRGLRQLAEAEPPRSQLGTAYNTARDAFVTAADRAAPALGEARQLYGASIAIEDMMAQGRRVFNMPEGEVDILLNGPRGRGLSIEEFDGFMLGVMDAIEQKIRAGDTAFVARFMRNENWQRQLERALGKTGARRLRNRIAREASMRRFDNSVRSGSQTTPMREDIQALTEGESELGFLSEVIQSGGEVRGPIARRLGEAIDRMRKPGIYNERVNQALAERLFQPATEGNMNALASELRDLREAQSRIDLINPQQAAASAYLGASSGRDKRRRLGQ